MIHIFILVYLYQLQDSSTNTMVCRISKTSIPIFCFIYSSQNIDFKIIDLTDLNICVPAIACPRMCFFLLSIYSIFRHSCILSWLQYTLYIKNMQLYLLVYAHTHFQNLCVVSVPHICLNVIRKWSNGAHTKYITYLLFSVSLNHRFTFFQVIWDSLGFVNDFGNTFWKTNILIITLFDRL